MTYPKLADIKKCTGCLACVDACAKQAIFLKVGEDGHFYVEIDKTKCIGCLHCEKICTNIHQDKYGDNSKTSFPFAVYNKEKCFYEKATSGGLFPALASYFILSGGVVYGAAYTDGIHVAHRRISKTDEIEALQGSKYEQSNLLGIYKSIAEDLKKDLKILFVGTGCQVAGVLSYFKNNRKKSLIYTADLVCGGVPSLLLIEAFATHTPQFATVNSYRDKGKYIFSYFTQDGIKKVCPKALPLDGFKSCLTNRYSCYDCEFTGLHRMSDWTLGDYWGDCFDLARSLCLCHSERGLSIVKSISNLNIQNIDWNFVCFNPRIINGKAPFANRIERKYIGLAFKKLPYSIVKKIYGSDIRKTDFLWYLYKIYKYIRFKLYFIHSKKIANKFINS